MIILFRGETVKKIDIEEQDKLQKHYLITNYGRIFSFTNGQRNYYEMKNHATSGFNVFRYKINVNGKYVTRSKLIYRLVAEHFVEKPSANHQFVIHLDYNNLNDHFENLKWVTAEERKIHHQSNPNIIQAHKRAQETKRKNGGIKLSTSDAIRIKKILKDPKRAMTLKQIAKRFHVSDMQIHRIKTGENWKHLEELFVI